MGLIVSGDRFTLRSWGNGLSYALTDKRSGREYFCQGDDAADFERERDNAEAAFPDKSNEEILAWLWDHYYSDAATETDAEES